MKEENCSSENAVDDRKYKVESDVLLVLGQRPDHEGHEAKAETNDQCPLHVLR